MGTSISGGVSVVLFILLIDRLLNLRVDRGISRLAFLRLS